MKKLLLHVLIVSLTLGWHTMQAQDELPEFKPFAHYINRSAMFEAAPKQPGAIVFVGNSITNNWDWSEFFSPRNGARILNRGIGGDVTAGVLHRMDEIIRHEPSKVFLMIGINDLFGNRSTAEIVRNVDRILINLQERCPQAELYLQSVLPVNKELFKSASPGQSSENIRTLNSELQALAARRSVTYIDLFPLMLDPSTDMLRTNFTTDGIHLSSPAYQQWINHIAPLVNN